MRKPTFEHRHYVKLAAIIAELPIGTREMVARLFQDQLCGTNPHYNAVRFYEAAMGAPCGRDMWPTGPVGPQGLWVLRAACPRSAGNRAPVRLPEGGR